MEIYLKIKKLIEDNPRLSQKELAKVLSVTGKTAHNYLNGHTKIIADHIPAIANYVGVSIEYLFKENAYGKKLELDYGTEPIVELYSCPDCRPRIKKIKEFEKTITELKDKLTQTHEKYIECLEELSGKKKATG